VVILPDPVVLGRARRAVLQGFFQISGISDCRKFSEVRSEMSLRLGLLAFESAPAWPPLHGMPRGFGAVLYRLPGGDLIGGTELCLNQTDDLLDIRGLCRFGRVNGIQRSVDAIL
jgi:hypothetical protein